jgi:hypothetical protein
MSLPEKNKKDVEELKARVKSLEDELDKEWVSTSDTDSSSDEDEDGEPKKKDDGKSDDESKSGVNNNNNYKQLDESGEKRRKKYTEEDVATEESRKDKLFELDDRLTKQEKWSKMLEKDIQEVYDGWNDMIEKNAENGWDKMIKKNADLSKQLKDLSKQLKDLEHTHQTQVDDQKDAIDELKMLWRRQQRTINFERDLRQTLRREVRALHAGPERAPLNNNQGFANVPFGGGKRRKRTRGKKRSKSRKKKTKKRRRKKKKKTKRR